MTSVLLFDLDGTLIDSREDLAAAVNHVRLSRRLSELSVEEIVPHIGSGMDRLLQETVGDTKGRELFIEFYGSHCVDQTRPYDGVKTILKEFSKKIRLGIVTNKPKGFSLKILDKLQLLGNFSVVVGGDSLKKKKPDPAPVRAALKELKAEAGRSWMIGDGWQDIEAGKRAGLRTCAVEYGFGYGKAVADLKPDRTVRKFEDVKEILV